MHSPGDQRERIIEVVGEKGMDCPEMVVEEVTAVLGGGQVSYRCTEDAPLEYLDLTPDQARYVRIDMGTQGAPETGGS